MTQQYAAISPSAQSLLMMKGHTNIPFARTAAELFASSQSSTPDALKQDMTFWARVLHFEQRYWSIDALLARLPMHNILELSSGYSFRGLSKTSERNDLYYIDTDLPDVIAAKQKMIAALAEPVTLKGTLELLPLNALDEEQFRAVVSRFPAGEIAIVNEGLLMYLDTEEKEKLCGIIRRVLHERGGCWITADVYLKNYVEKLQLQIGERTKQFFEQHRIEEKKYESFEEAKQFFERMGFVLEQEAEVNHARLSALPHLMQSCSPEQLQNLSSKGKMQATWRLRAAKK